MTHLRSQQRQPTDLYSPSPFFVKKGAHVGVICLTSRGPRGRCGRPAGLTILYRLLTVRAGGPYMIRESTLTAPDAVSSHGAPVMDAYGRNGS